jgi:hypothetical protein
MGGAVGRGRRTVAVGLAVTAAALAASAASGAVPRPVAAARGPAVAARVDARPAGGAGAERPGPRAPLGADGADDADGRHVPGQVPRDAGAEGVRAPVRIADAAAVALLRPGDRVDVLAGARVVASGVPVVAVPGLPPLAPGRPGRESAPLSGSAGDTGSAEGPGGVGAAGTGGGGGGALVVLSVPRRTAAALSGAALSSPLAVALC